MLIEFGRKGTIFLLNISILRPIFAFFYLKKMYSWRLGLALIARFEKI